MLKLDYLKLNDNTLCGGIPMEVCALDLTTLEVDSNIGGCVLLL